MKEKLIYFNMIFSHGALVVSGTVRLSLNILGKRTHCLSTADSREHPADVRTEKTHPASQSIRLYREKSRGISLTS